MRDRLPNVKSPENFIAGWADRYGALPSAGRGWKAVPLMDGSEVRTRAGLRGEQYSRVLDKANDMIEAEKLKAQQEAKANGVEPDQSIMDKKVNKKAVFDAYVQKLRDSKSLVNRKAGARLKNSFDEFKAKSKAITDEQAARMALEEEDMPMAYRKALGLVDNTDAALKLTLS